MSEPLVDQHVLQSTLDRALRGGGDFAEVFVEDRRSSSARFDDGRVEELVSGRDRGAGLRVVRGETTGFAHTADLSPEGLSAAADAAAAAARGGGGGVKTVALSQRPTPPRPGADDVVAPETVAKSRKVDLLRSADAAARAQGGAITSVTASYADADRRILVANSDGLLADDDQVRTRMMVQCVATGDTGMQTGYEAPGRTMGFELFDTIEPEQVGRTAATRALSLLEAVPAPTGKIPVVLRRGAGGVLMHEACGHGLEADHIYKDASVFSGDMGKLVASPLVTLVDDGTYGREWGTLSIDDEGHPAQRNVLIEDGVLTEYMWDLLRARKEGHASSGNGRRETYRHLPMPRMTNTFVLEGETDPADIVRGVDYGIYCVQLGGGSVNPATGDFVFGVTEAYLIEHGEITRPIRAAELIGNGPDVLRGIDAVGNDFDTWTGMCGKNGQSVPVSSGQPTVLVREMTVGGTAALSQSPELLDIARGVAAKAGAGEQVEAYVIRSRETEVEVFGGEVESLTTAVVEGIGVRVVVDHRQGYAWAGSLEPSVIEETLRDARDNAAFGEPDEWYALATPADANGVTPAILDVWREELAAIPTDEKVAIALELERATKAADSRIRNVESAGYGDGSTESAIANSLGVEAQQRRTMCSASSSAIADDGTGAQTGYGFVAGRTLADLDLESVPRDAAIRACRLLGAKPIAGRRIPVILDPLVTRSVLGVLSSAFNGESVLKGRSLFAGREGESIAAARVNVIDDPTDPRALGAATYDSEGVPTRPIALIANGVLNGFLQNVYTGRRSGAGTTGSASRGYTSTPGVGVRALRFEPGDHSPEQIMASVPEALYVQSVSGLHSGTNPISGDFSVGAEGLMVRGGELAEPVREVTVASTLQRMLLDIADIGADLTFLPGAVAGMTVLLSDMTVSGS